MIHFLIGFLLLIFAGSLFILGFHTITRGKYVVLPNGEIEKDVEIFGFWQLFWEDIKSYNKVYYREEQLRFKLKILEQLRPSLIGKVKMSPEEYSLIFSDKLNASQLRDIEFSLNSKVHYNEIALFVYEEYPIYRFPEWVRNITNCYVCLSSIGGSIFYWVYASYFPFFDLPTFQKVVLWITYCITLSFVNKIIKLNLDK